MWTRRRRCRTALFWTFTRRPRRRQSSSCATPMAWGGCRPCACGRVVCFWGRGARVRRWRARLWALCGRSEWARGRASVAAWRHSWAQAAECVSRGGVVAEQTRASPRLFVALDGCHGAAPTTDARSGVPLSCVAGRLGRLALYVLVWSGPPPSLVAHDRHFW